MKAIYHTMNLFNLEVNQKCLIAECWAPVCELTRIKLALDKGTELSGSQIPSILNRMETKELPPTYHIVNKFTSGFQGIVDAYGIASYREFNPAPFTVITFPFLFAVMFGDAGHGLIMLLFALFMVLRENQLKSKGKDNEVWQIFFGGRYIILLMALFSIYTGFIYNDVFSKSLNLFGSSWRVGVTTDFPFEKVAQFNMNPDPEAPNDRMFVGEPYPYGLDPVWQLAINKISFTNSLKMKFSVIIGIMQMCFGLFLSFLNHMFFGRTTSVLFEFIPQIIFMLFIFVYLCVMIVIKWLKYSGHPSDVTGPGCAPNLLIELIDMFFLKTQAANANDCMTLYPGQSTIQQILIVIAVLSIPVMLFVKPTLIYLKHKKQSQRGQRLADEGHLNPIDIGDEPREHSQVEVGISGASTTAKSVGHGGHGEHGDEPV
jgi:V-type H+-transporting ATPase subunit a